MVSSIMVASLPAAGLSVSPDIMTAATDNGWMEVSMTAATAAVLFCGGALSAVPGLVWVRSGRWQRAGEPNAAAPWWWVVLAGLGVVVVWWRLGDQSRWPAAAAAALLVVVGGAGVLIDVAVKRVPEPLVLGLYAASGVLLGGGALVTGQWGHLGRAVGHWGGGVALLLPLRVHGSDWGSPTFS